MASAHDVAAYILKARGPMSSMKLQKLLYYSQAWHLVWDEEPLFRERIQAWANGPVVYEVFRRHRGQFTVHPPWPKGDPANLTDSERETVDAVLHSYGDLTGRKLSALTHDEAPWREAREGLAPTERSSVPISLDRMQDFYASLDADKDAKPIDELDWDEPF
jgi:uncharacterized phage-associated protein